MIFVAFIEGDDEGHLPALGGQAEEADGIVGSVEGRDADRQVEGFATVIEGCQAMDAVVAVTVGDGDHERQLTGVLGAVGGELVQAVAIDPALAVAVPAPEGPRVTVGT